MKKQRKKLITEETEIIIDESAFQEIAKRLICEMFVEYVNDKYGYSVLELKY